MIGYETGKGGRQLRLILLLGVITGLGLLLVCYHKGQPWVPALRLGGLYWTGLIILHAVLRLGKFRGDEVLLPLVGYFCALSLIILYDIQPAIAWRQLCWILVGLALVPFLVLRRNWWWLSDFKYLAGTAGLLLLFLTAAFGREYGGARLWLAVGPLRFESGEIVRIFFSIFLAGMLSEHAELFTHPTAAVGPMWIPELRYSLPLLFTWLIFLFIFLVQRDLGTALLYYILFTGLLFAVTGRFTYVAVALVLGVASGGMAALLFEHVRSRFQIWLNPWPAADGRGYQIVQSLFALANGGWIGRGLGYGLSPRIPASYTDLLLVVIGEELGFAGFVAVIVGYLLLIGKGFGVALCCSHEFNRLLGVALVLSWTTSIFLVTAGFLRLLPLTGLTTPFLSYGGTAMVTNFLSLGLLLHFSHQGEKRC